MAYQTFLVHEEHEPWCALMRAQMDEVDTATGTMSVPSEHVQICHTCDAYPCACNAILNGTFAVLPKKTKEWEFRINGREVTKEAWETYHASAKRTEDLINMREGKIDL